MIEYCCVGFECNGCLRWLYVNRAFVSLYVRSGREVRCMLWCWDVCVVE